jgi:hypothetical protein
VTIKKQQPVVSAANAAAGRKMWAASSKRGELAASSVDFERNAQKTWIRYVDARGEEKCVIECELYMQASATRGGELVGMLHAECPCCRNTVLVREDNKEMSLGSVRFDAAPAWLCVHWRYHMAEKYGLRSGLVLERLGRLPTDAEMMRPPRGEDPIPLVSGTNRVEEPWLCDYCHRWGVNVYEGVARDHDTGRTAERIISHGPAGPSRPGGAIEV